MSLHVAPNTGCNLGCTYCYETPDRERKQEWVDRQYEMDEIMTKLEEWHDLYPGETPGLHGGEPLLMRKEHIRQIFQWVHDHYNRGPGIQTNGTLMDEDHVDMFEKYGVHVGLSCDGPGELNQQRKAAGERKSEQSNATDKMTERTQGAIEELVERDIPCSVIVVLHETNAGTDEKLERLLDWMDWLNENGVYGHFNPAIPYENIQQDISLDPSRLKEVYLRTWEWMKEEPYREWNPMKDYIDNLLGNGLGNCVNERCDVFNTKHAKIVKGNGESTGCGKTWEAVGDGVPFLQGPSSGNEYEETEERYELLKQTPGVHGDEPDMGGCKGCKYWNVCQGGCPSAGFNDDHRNRARWCEAKYALYEQIEHDIRAIMPNVDLITDFPWDANIYEARNNTRWSGDWNPFEAVRPGSEGQSSAYKYSSSENMLMDRVPDMVFEGTSFDEKVEMFKNEYDEDSLVVNREEGLIHADSSRATAEEQDEPEEESDESETGWEPVEDEPDEDCGCNECGCK